MTGFDRREEALEAKSAPDEKRAFKARARLADAGLVGCGKRGETGTITEDYGRTLIDADISAVPNAAFNKLVFDLACVYRNLIRVDE
jgi:Domain of unknown function (DUF1476).